MVARILLIATGLLMLWSLDRSINAQEMHLRDRLAMLNSNQVIFDRRGEPLVSVRVVEARGPVRLSSTGRLTLLPGGDERSRVRAPVGTTWTVSLDQSRPGQVRHWVVAERFPATDLDATWASRKRWTEAGHEVATFESGALIGLAGRTLDTRWVSVVIDPQPSEPAAQAHAERLAAQSPILGWVMAELVQRPGGTLLAQANKRGVEVLSQDLLWFSVEPPHTIEIAVGPANRQGHPKPIVKGRYQGDVYVAIGETGTLAVVNLLSAEALLEGVVPAEIYPSAPKASLRVQAVAARGQLLAKVGTRHRGDPYLLCAETHCQVYGGSGRSRPRTTEAVRATRGELLFHDGGLVDTVYSSACGGHTEAFHLMWGGQPKRGLGGIPDTPQPFDSPTTESLARYIDEPPPGAWCAPSGRRSKTFRWRVTRSGRTVSQAVNQRAPVGAVSEIQVLRRGRSGRALTVAYVGAKGRHVVEGEYANRKLLGGLRSGMWLVTREGNAQGEPKRWIFRGGGFGHGVGMCQHGAMGMAAAGHDHAHILGHYYPGSELIQAW